MSNDQRTAPVVSLIIVTYQMDREIRRTLDTVHAQLDVDVDEIEVIVVDNGSPSPFDAQLLDRFANARSIRIDPAPPSPVTAVNTGLAAATTDLIGVFIDGARMLSPGLVAGSLRAAELAPTPVIASLAFHLGPDVQMVSAGTGYDQHVEDALLDSVDWRADGYELFDISVLAASSSRGWFGPMGECNSLFLRRAQWDELGGYDPAFVRPGGGLANHDVYRRACELDGAELFVLLGEGTFHQYHGGAATSGARQQEIWDEYERLRGRPYRPPNLAATLIGHLPAPARRHLASSLDWLDSTSPRR